VDFNEKMNELETIVWSSSLELTGGGHLVGDHALCGCTSTEDRIWRRLAMVWIDHLDGVHESGKRVDDRRRVAPCLLGQRSKLSQVEKYLTLSLASLAAWLPQ
jgi:hypothetical protein